MSAPGFTLTMPAAESGDQIAAVLHAVADRFANEVDGLTPPVSSGIHKIEGRTVAEWSVNQ
ncbi:hypothetical protein [Microbacterium sp. T32]|uniref:hypothetical protein n=1 Tax=Microbacterium sp. T32 TaxID=1776083 RepID=UPI0007AB694C|nr:hypothetical protein [Microbacterium sp. T32]KZE41394.1 hypothetical protein AVW09_02060 [Microbacterium sp. T32]